MAKKNHYLVTFLQAICVEAPEGTDDATIMNAGRQYMLDNYSRMEDFVGDQNCSSIEIQEGEVNGYRTKVRIIEEIMDDVSYEESMCEPTVVIK